jgi:hypothetical protein
MIYINIIIISILCIKFIIIFIQYELNLLFCFILYFIQYFIIILLLLMFKLISF